MTTTLSILTILMGATGLLALVAGTIHLLIDNFLGSEKASNVFKIIAIVSGAIFAVLLLAYIVFAIALKTNGTSITSFLEDCKPWEKACEAFKYIWITLASIVGLEILSVLLYALGAFPTDKVFFYCFPVTILVMLIFGCVVLITLGSCILII